MNYPRPRHGKPHPPAGLKRVGLARVLSKLGYCSRSRAAELIQAGLVKLNGAVARDPEQPVIWPRDRIEVEGRRIGETEKLYLALNKPRGLVTSRSDEQGRDTVYECFKDARLPFLSPVGRLDKASEGLLLFTNDTEWAARVTDPQSRVQKEYHVQIDVLPDAALADRLARGVLVDGEHLGATRVEVLRVGTTNGWLRIILEEGRNRHIRRLLEAFKISVLRLVRVSIGPVLLGQLAKGKHRLLTPEEVRALGHPAQRPR